MTSTNEKATKSDGSQPEQKAPEPSKDILRSLRVRALILAALIIGVGIYIFQFSGLSSSTSKGVAVASKTQDAPTLDSVKEAFRLVSLAPSNTELIYALGGEERLLGVSTFCCYPEQVNEKPKMGTFLEAKMETLKTTRPDVILLVSGQEPLQIKLKKQGYKTVLLPNTKLSDIATNIRVMGRICGEDGKANALANKFEGDLTELHSIVSSTTPKSVFFCIWPEPIMTVGSDSFLNDVITKCGGTNIASGIKTSYPVITFERVLSSNPKTIILPAESKETFDLEKKPWATLSAIEKKDYFYLPERKEDFLSRPSLRINKGLHWLSSRLHPELSDKLDAWLRNAEK